MASYLDDEYDDQILEAIRLRRERQAALDALQSGQAHDPLNIAADLAIGIGGGVAGGLMGTDGGAIAARALELKRKASESRLKALDGAPEIAALTALARMRAARKQFQEGNVFKAGESQKNRDAAMERAKVLAGLKAEEGDKNRNAAQKRVETQVEGSQARTDSTASAAMDRLEKQITAAMQRLEAQQGGANQRQDSNLKSEGQRARNSITATLKPKGFIPFFDESGELPKIEKDPTYVPPPPKGSGPKDESDLNIPGYSMTPGFKPTKPEAQKLRDAVAVMNTFDKNINQMQDMIKKRGSFEFFGKDSAVMKSLYTGMQMDLKNLYDLGAITGPDMQILENQLLNPGGPSGLFSKDSTAIAGLEQLRKQLKQMVSERLKARGFQSQGGSPDPDAKADEWLRSRGFSPSPAPSSSGKPSKQEILQELMKRQQMKKGAPGG